MRSRWITGGNRQKKQEYKNDPNTFEEARRRIIDLEKGIAMTDAQLEDPRMKNGKSNKEYRIWRTKAMKSRAHMQEYLSNTRLWIELEEERLREKLLRQNGLNPTDPMSMLGGVYAVTMSLITTKEIERSLDTTQRRVLSQARHLLVGEV